MYLKHIMCQLYLSKAGKNIKLSSISLTLSLILPRIFTLLY